MYVFSRFLGACPLSSTYNPSHAHILPFTNVTILLVHIFQRNILYSWYEIDIMQDRCALDLYSKYCRRVLL